MCPRIRVGSQRVGGSPDRHGSLDTHPISRGEAQVGPQVRRPRQSVAMNEREKRREKRRRRAGKHYRTVDLGNGIEQATPEAVFRAMGGLPPDLDWPILAPNVIPILPRRRPMPSQAGEPLKEPEPGRPALVSEAS